MNKKLLLLILLSLISLALKAQQVVANPVPDLTNCTYVSFNLTTQNTIALGNQNPQNHTVKFFTSVAAANQNTSAITNPTNYITQQIQVIYLRVTNESTTNFAVTSFTLFPRVLPMPAESYYFNCSSFVLPPHNYGNYYTGPNGTGTMIAAGTSITQNTVIYAHATSGTCTGNTKITIEVFNVPPGNPLPYVLCTATGTFATFNLTTRSDEISGNEWASVTFHLTEAGAAADTNIISNPAAYTATALQQTVYARILVDGSPMCIWVKPLQLITEPCTTNSISGTIRYDADSNGCTQTDVAAENISVYNATSNATYQTFTDAAGNYTFTGTPNGSNIVSVTPLQPSNSVSAPHNVTLPGIVTGKDFCITVPNPVQDVSLVLIPVSNARPGFNATYSLVFSNSGTLPASGNVSLTFPSAKVNYVSSYPAMAITGNMLTFNYVNLMPFQTRHINITFLVQPPQIVPLGDILIYNAAISAASDSNIVNNTSELNQAVVNSYDPNDIRVKEGQYITEQQANGYLHYTIRFQNIGNAPALKVRIENTLNANLDWTTLQPVAASHNYNIQRLAGQLRFTFNNINLPGSQVNEPGSHGYVTYKIKPKAAIQLGDVITAEAGIYFDFNPVVETNTITTTVQNAMAADDFAANSFRIYPNPASGTVMLQLKNAASADVRISDVMGKTVLISKISETESSLNIAALNSGMYFITLTAEGRSATKKLVVK